MNKNIINDDECLCYNMSSYGFSHILLQLSLNVFYPTPPPLIRTAFSTPYCLIIAFLLFIFSILHMFLPHTLLYLSYQTSLLSKYFVVLSMRLFFHIFKDVYHCSTSRLPICPQIQPSICPHFQPLICPQI